MKCSRCQVDTPSDARSCPQCGAALIVACPQCGIGNAPPHSFCKKCGQALGPLRGLGSEAPPRPAHHAYTPKHLAERILTSRAALDGERTHLTVVVADLKGSVEMLARDPEAKPRSMAPT